MSTARSDGAEPTQRTRAILRLAVRDDVPAVLARGAAGSLALNVAGVGLGFATQVVLARVMGPGPYGDYAFVGSWLLVLALGALTGGCATITRGVTQDIQIATDEVRSLRVVGNRDDLDAAPCRAHALTPFQDLAPLRLTVGVE